MEYWHSVLHMITVNVEWFSLTYLKLLTINCWKLFSNLITAVMGCSLHRRLLSRTYIDLEIINTLSCYNVLSPVQASSHFISRCFYAKTKSPCKRDEVSILSLHLNKSVTFHSSTCVDRVTVVWLHFFIEKLLNVAIWLMGTSCGVIFCQ